MSFLFSLFNCLLCCLFIALMSQVFNWAYQYVWSCISASEKGCVPNNMLQLLNYMPLTWDMHIQNVARLINICLLTATSSSFRKSSFWITSTVCYFIMHMKQYVLTFQEHLILPPVFDGFVLLSICFSSCFFVCFFNLINLPTKDTRLTYIPDVQFVYKDASVTLKSKRVEETK